MVSRMVICAVVVGTTALAHAELRGEGLDDRWTRALDAVAASLAGRDDVDGAVEIVVVSAGAEGVRVIARRSSGASAERPVETPDDLGPTILALVVVPPAPAPERVSPVIDSELPDDPSLRMRAPPPSPHDARVELGAMVGARRQGSMAVGGGAFATLEKQRWLVGANAGWSIGQSEQLAVDAETNALLVRCITIELGVEIGRRIELGPFEMTAQLGPRIAWSRRSFQDVPAPRAPIMVAYDVPDVTNARIAGGVRVRWASSSRVQLFLGVDASVDVATLYGSPHVSSDHTIMVATIEPPQRALGVALVLGGAFGVVP